MFRDISVYRDMSEVYSRDVLLYLDKGCGSTQLYTSGPQPLTLGVTN